MLEKNKHNLKHIDKKLAKKYENQDNFENGKD